MMSFALLVCAVTLFVVLSVFGSSLIKPVTNSLDTVGVNGKLNPLSLTTRAIQADRKVFPKPGSPVRNRLWIRNFPNLR